MITLGDTARILAKAAAYDQRTIGDADIAAWHEALGYADPPITAADALTAVAAWHAEALDDRRIRPADVIRTAQRIAHRRAGAERAAQLAEQAELEAAETEDRTADRDELLAHLAGKFGTGDPRVLRRREWVEWESNRRRAERAAAEPNPHFRGLPPPGGWPVPNDAETA